MAKAVTRGNSIESTTIPDLIKPQLEAGYKQYGEAQSAFTPIAGIPGQMPLLDVPGLTPEQQQVIARILAQGETTPDIAAARGQLESLTSGPIGSSPATQQAMQAYQQFEAPRLLQQAALAGRGTGGAALEALGMGSQQAMLPLLQQEIQNREAAVGQYGNLQNQQLSSLAMALEASGMPREVAAEQAKALYEQQQQKVAFEQMVQTIPLQLIPRLLGKKQDFSTTSYQTKTGEDYWGNILGGLLGG